MASLTDILTSIQQGVQAVNNLAIQMRNSFPQATASSSTVNGAGSTGPTVTFNSSQAAAFQTVVTSSGATYKSPLYYP